MNTMTEREKQRLELLKCHDYQVLKLISDDLMDEIRVAELNDEKESLEVALQQKSSLSKAMACLAENFFTKNAPANGES